MSRWDVVPIKHLGVLTVGRHFQRYELGVTGRPVIQIGDLDDQRAPMRRFEDDLPPRFEVRPGDLLITQLQPVRVRRWSGDTGWLGPRLVKFDPDPKRVDQLFAFHVLSWRLPDLESHLQGTTIPHLGAATLGELRVPAPPLVVQQELGRELEHATGLSAQLAMTADAISQLCGERLAALTEQLAFPADAPLARLRFLFDAASGTVPMEPSRELVFSEHGDRLVPASEADAVRGIDVRKARPVAVGDLVVRRLASGALEAAVAERAGCVSSRFPVLVPHPGADAGFIAHALRTRGVWRQTSARAEDRQRFFGLSQLLDLRVPALPGGEQARRAERLDHERAVNAEVTRAADRARSLLRSWTQRRMTDLLNAGERTAS
jgi:type I restriction modification DNA specificity protein